MFAAVRLFTTALLFTLPLAAYDSGRDFAGTWYLDARHTNMRAISLPAAQTLTVTQQDTSIQCAATYADGATQSWSYRIDGTETRLHAGDSTESSVVKWEGAALLVNTLVSGPRDYTVMDRWALTNSGAQLTITRQVVLREGQAEGSLVYTRQPSAETMEPRAATAEAAPQPEIEHPRELVKQPAAMAPADLVVAHGTHIGLALRNSLDTKHTQEGDHVYLETIAPIAIAGQIVIPRGSYVNGTVTQSKPAKGIKTKGEMYIRFDSLVLPNGVSRDFHSRLISADSTAHGTVDSKEGKVTGERDSSGDVRTVATGTGVGATVGAIAGSAAGHPLTGVGIGAATGAAVGLATIFHGKRPEAVLPRGTIVEMVLDRDLTFSRNELPY
jgi:type IV secretion system protein VirB10